VVWWSPCGVDHISGVREFGVGLVSWSLVATSTARTKYRLRRTGGGIQVLETARTNQDVHCGSLGHSR